MTEKQNDVLDTIVIGAGQAGLGMAYYLKRDGRRFVVLERGRIGETWRSQRWDSFALNTPNWSNVLPGDSYDGPEPDGFWLRDELVESFERYARKFALPVRTGVTVTAVEHSDDEGVFAVHTDGANGSVLQGRSVVVASGILQSPNTPALSSKVPDSIKQLHTGDYRSPGALPPGAVVVVGGGQSGCQIVEDLLEGGREVYLCTSKVGRLRRRYRGRDMLEWWVEMGFLDITEAELEDKTVRFATQPQISGRGRLGHTVSLQQLARQGAKLLGRLVDIEDGVLITDDKLPEYMKFADEKSAAFKRDVDDYLERAGIEPPPLEDDPADEAADMDELGDTPTRLDLAAAGVAAIVWSTGFTADFSWLPASAVDDEGRPVHELGVATIPGLYFLGFPWLRRRKSGIIVGIADDARDVASAIAGHLGDGSIAADR